MYMSLFSFLKKPSSLFAFVIGIILLSIILALIFLSFTTKIPEKPTTNTTSFSEKPITPTTSPAPIIFESLSPKEGQLLNAGEIATFTLLFKEPISPDRVAVAFSYFDDVKNLSFPISVKKITNVSSKKIVLETTEALKQTTQYSLQIVDSTTESLIFSAVYVSSEILPTPIQTNNSKLIPYLPYETSNFKLEYFPERNIYIFHFIDDESLPTDLSEQFAKAKADAIKFIESKGIDLKTIMIEWRSS